MENIVLMRNFRKRVRCLLIPIMVLFTFQSSFAFYKSEIRNLKSEIYNNPFKYCGYYEDSESDLYYLNARYYSPELMRFISRDTYDLSNRYAYCNGDPTSNADPGGHLSTMIGIAGGLIGASVIADIATMLTASGFTGALMVASTLSAIGGNVALDKAAGASMNTSDYLSIGIAGLGSIVGMYATNPEIFNESWQGSALIGRSMKDGRISNDELFNTGCEMAGVKTRYSIPSASPTELLGDETTIRSLPSQDALNCAAGIRKRQSRCNALFNAVSQGIGGIGNNIAHPSDKGMISNIALGALVGLGTGFVYGQLGELTKVIQARVQTIRGAGFAIGCLGGAFRSGFVQLSKDLALNGQYNIDWTGVGMGAGLGVFSYTNQIGLNNNPLSKANKIFFSVYRSKKDLILNHFLQQ